MARGMARSVSGSEACSFKQGIWTMSFILGLGLGASRATVAQGPPARLAGRFRLASRDGRPPRGVEAELPEVVEDDRRVSGRAAGAARHGLDEPSHAARVLGRHAHGGRQEPEIVVDRGVAREGLYPF